MTGNKFLLLWVCLVLVYIHSAIPLDLASGPVKPREECLESYAGFHKTRSSPAQAPVFEFILSLLESKKIEEITFQDPTPILTSP